MINFLYFLTDTIAAVLILKIRNEEVSNGKSSIS